jgi:hypothetical protein
MHTDKIVLNALCLPNLVCLELATSVCICVHLWLKMLFAPMALVPAIGRGILPEVMAGTSPAMTGAGRIS